MPMTELERILVEGCRQGDQEAWRTLYRTYAPDIARYLRGMVTDRSDVEDLVQTCLIKFLSSIDHFRGEASLRTWLHCIARNVALHEIRGRTRRERHLAAYARSSHHESPGPDGAVEARDQLDRVMSLLHELDAPFRDVWVLREIQQLEVSECAVILDLPNSTVRTRHHRARQKLLALLETQEQAPSQRLRLIASEGGES